MKLYYFIILLCFVHAGFAQDTHTLKGEIRNKLTDEPVPFANVVNMCSLRGTQANEQAKFIIELQHTDSFAISAVGFNRTYNKLPDSLVSDSIYIFYIEPMREHLEEVQVTGAKYNFSWEEGLSTGKGENVSAEYRKVKGWNSKFSKQNKRKGEVLALQKDQQEWEELKKRYTPGIVFEITGFSEPKLTEFIHFLARTHPVPADVNEYQLRTTIIKGFPEFLKNGNKVE
ncbi:MAG: hypothetical protein ACK5MI_04360 [Mangrovibacterium sp.]